MWDVSAALHVMTAGSYRLLPKIIESPPWVMLKKNIPAALAKETHERLSYQVWIRLLTTRIPQQIDDIRVEGGIAYLRAGDEFEIGVSLRMRGEDLNDPALQGMSEQERVEARVVWALFKIRILIAEEGKENAGSLVTEQEIQWLSQHLNELILEEKEPIILLYDRVHLLCLRLSLELLYGQSSLITERFGANHRLEYKKQSSLVIRYWISAPDIPLEGQIMKKTPGDRKNGTAKDDIHLKIHIDRHNMLSISHNPPLQWKDGDQKINQNAPNGSDLPGVCFSCLSLDSILEQVVIAHANHRVLALKRFIEWRSKEESRRNYESLIVSEEAATEEQVLKSKKRKKKKKRKATGNSISTGTTKKKKKPGYVSKSLIVALTPLHAIKVSVNLRNGSFIFTWLRRCHQEKKTTDNAELKKATGPNKTDSVVGGDDEKIAPGDGRTAIERMGVSIPVSDGGRWEEITNVRLQRLSREVQDSVKETCEDILDGIKTLRVNATLTHLNDLCHQLGLTVSSYLHAHWMAEDPRPFGKNCLYVTLTHWREFLLGLDLNETNNTVKMWLLRTSFAGPMRQAARISHCEELTIDGISQKKTFFVDLYASWGGVPPVMQVGGSSEEEGIRLFQESLRKACSVQGEVDISMVTMINTKKSLIPMAEYGITIGFETNVSASNFLSTIESNPSSVFRTQNHYDTTRYRVPYKVKGSIREGLSGGIPDAWTWTTKEISRILSECEVLAPIKFIEKNLKNHRRLSSHLYPAAVTFLSPIKLKAANAGELQAAGLKVRIDIETPDRMRKAFWRAETTHPYFRNLKSLVKFRRMPGPITSCQPIAMEIKDSVEMNCKLCLRYSNISPRMIETLLGHLVAFANLVNLVTELLYFNASQRSSDASKVPPKWCVPVELSLKSLVLQFKEAGSSNQSPQTIVIRSEASLERQYSHLRLDMSPYKYPQLVLLEEELNKTREIVPFLTKVYRAHKFIRLIDPFIKSTREFVHPALLTQKKSEINGIFVAPKSSERLLLMHVWPSTFYASLKKNGKDHGKDLASRQKLDLTFDTADQLWVTWNEARSEVGEVPRPYQLNLPKFPDLIQKWIQHAKHAVLRKIWNLHGSQVIGTSTIVLESPLKVSLIIQREYIFQVNAPADVLQRFRQSQNLDAKKIVETYLHKLIRKKGPAPVLDIEACAEALKHPIRVLIHIVALLEAEMTSAMYNGSIICVTKFRWRCAESWWGLSVPF
uniref:Mediator of RNA polymerase II transcription subunit 14 n=1 Tax=Lotharella globosa TaxID=91324 RepID=A0A6V3NGC5_9EUKA